MNGATATLKGKSMFGVQELSRRRTAPAHGFGSSTRNHASKVFMGPEHAKTSSLSCTPGPCYEVAGACGSQHDSGKVSPPQWCFGTAERFSRTSRGKHPGPGAYENAGSFGKQDLSNRSTFPLYGFGTVDRSMAAKVRAARRRTRPNRRGSGAPASIHCICVQCIFRCPDQLSPLPSYSPALPVRLRIAGLHLSCACFICLRAGVAWPSSALPQGRWARRAQVRVWHGRPLQSPRASAERCFDAPGPWLVFVGQHAGFTALFSPHHAARLWIWVEQP